MTTTAAGPIPSVRSDGGSDRARPLPATMRVHEARDAYLAENGFTVDEYDAKTTKASLFGVSFVVPNTERHRWAIMLHDLHHAATGYGTDLAGEAEVSAWELRRGLRGLGLYVGAIVAGGALLGLAVAPLRTLRAWRASDAGGSLFQSDVPYDALLAMPLGELRSALRLPEDGLTTVPRGLHAKAPRRA